ncbi:MAG: hypothetical protein ACD_22C00206G0005 [uncultured bacterium]|nr:MAG: hypothetical protein ACD_22C00206G0005 [uncultured bacterium]
MEHRILLTQEEAFELSKELEIIGISFVKDEYTGEKRFRIDEAKKKHEKDYLTPVKGTTVRFSAKCKLGTIGGVWFEVKWTNNKVRFEIEFEGEVPEKYLSRPNIRGWEILK